MVVLIGTGCVGVQGQAAAGQALEEAMAATREAAQRVDATVSILRQVQVSFRA